MEDALQRALVQLYDPLYLRKSPLLAMLRLQQQPEPARALRETLLAAIDALKPEPGTPSEGQRYYQVLYFRYVQRLTVIDVAGQLGLSPRHLRGWPACSVTVTGLYRRPQSPRLQPARICPCPRRRTLWTLS